MSRDNGLTVVPILRLWPWSLSIQEPVPGPCSYLANALLEHTSHYLPCAMAQLRRVSFRALLVLDCWLSGRLTSVRQGGGLVTNLRMTLKMVVDVESS